MSHSILASSRPLMTAIALAACCHAAQADTLVFSGNLGNAANTALVSSTLAAPSFASNADIANNVALYSFTLATGGAVTISTFDGAAGVDPYFTLFKGTGATATFAASNYDHAYFTSGGDFTLPLTLAAGSYTLALGTFANMSFAENRGTGTLADGFIGLGETTSLGSGFYQVDVITAAVPEPATTALWLLGLAAVGGLRKVRPRA